MADRVYHRSPEGSTASTDSPFFFVPDQFGPISAPYIAELVWIDRIQPHTLREGECLEGRLAPDALVVLAAAKGSQNIRADGFCGRLYRGQAAFLPMREGTCRVSAAGTGQCLIAVLRGRMIREVLDQRFAENRLFCPTGLSDVLEAAHALREEAGGTEQISLAAYRLLLRLHETAVAYEQSSGYPLLVTTAMEIMREEFAHLYGINEVADRLEITAGYLARLFAQSVGMTPGRFLKLQKIEHAKKLLTLPDMTVTLCAELCGFSNANYFSKVFHRETGVLPSVYAQAHASEDLADERLRQTIDEMYL